MTKTYILLSLEDDRAIALSKILGNKTCKKIIDALAQNDSSEKDIADALNMPLNTVEYNLKKLIKAEIIEKTKTFFWSIKGKKIPIYTVSNKSIIITPKKKISSKLKSILPVALVSGAGAFIVKLISDFKSSPGAIMRDTSFQQAESMLAGSMEKVATTITTEQTNIFITSQPFPVWGWFLSGALIAILIFTILNWKKI